MKKIVIVFCSFVLFLSAQNLKIAAGAGYKKPLIEVLNEYENSYNKIDAFFGNMKQVSAQAKQTNIALIIGDKSFLENRSNLDFKGFQEIGKGKVVLAFRKNIEINSINELKSSKIQRISMPQSKKAIYGIAGKQFLENSKLYNEVKRKLYVVATVPQAMTYVITNEVDAGIVNLTAALANKDKIGGYIEIPSKLYKPIFIVAGKLNACNTKKCEEFLSFLNTNKAKKIFEKYGL